MMKTTQGMNWIGAYLEWAGLKDDEPGPVAEEVTEFSFANAYLDWLENNPLFMIKTRGRGRRASDLLEGAQDFREAVLLAALHAQSDCLHILRQVLDQGTAGAGTIRLASEALEAAQRLLDDERHAWHALGELRVSSDQRADRARPAKANGEWPEVLEHVASDVSLLTNTVLAMQPH